MARRKYSGKKPARSKKAKTRAEESVEQNEKEQEYELFTDPGEILKAVKYQQAEMEDLRTRMEDDFDVYKLTEYSAKSGYESYTSTAPKNFFDKILDGVNRAALTINIRTDEGAKEDERDDANQGELFLIGALNDIDRRARFRREKALRRNIAFMACLRGWIALRCLVYIPEGEKNTIFDVLSWDPMHVTWEDGPGGLIWAAYQRKATKSQIHAEYGYIIEGQDALVTDFWTREKNCILVNGEFIKEPMEHMIGHVPIFIGNVGDMPDIQQKDFTGQTLRSNNTLEYQGESVWSTARDIIEPRNQYISQLMDTAKRSVAGSLVHKSKAGDKKIKGDPYASFQEIVIEEGEEIYPLDLPSAPPETAAILGAIDHDWQQSTLPYPLAYGGTQAAESGRALAIRIEATRSAYSPRTHLLRECYQWLCEEILGQFANPKRKNKAVDLHGESNEMSFFQVTKKPTDVKEDWVVDVIVEPRLPRDEAEEINMSIAATRSGGSGEQPLMAISSARRDILKLKNPDLEEQRVLAEMGKALPPIMNRRIAAAMASEGDEEGAEILMNWINSQEQGAQAAPTDMSGQPIGATAPAGAPAATNGAAPQRAGPSPEETQLLQEVMTVLVEAGRQDLAQELAQTLDGAAAPRDGLLDEIINVLQNSGAGELAQALLQALGAGQPTGQPTGQPVAPAQPIAQPQRI